jgi:ribosomal protein S27AE
MPERYIHLSGKKLDDMTLKNLYRINTEGKKEKREIAMSPKVCPNCGESNPSDYDFCLKCKWALDNNSISRPEKEYWKTVTLEKLEKLVDEKLEEIVIRRMGNS